LLPSQLPFLEQAVEPLEQAVELLEQARCSALLLQLLLLLKMRCLWLRQ
jgi:hypothetical protein